MEVFTSVDAVQLRHNLARFRHFADFVDRRLDVHIVTPLLNFSFNEMYLNRISYEFTKYLRKQYIDVEGALLLLSKPPRLPCISVQVVERENLIFCAHMLSLSIIMDGPHTALPLMCIMINKKPALGNSTKSFLEKRFCCGIIPCELSDSQFQWLMGIAINETMNRYINGGITITHKVNRASANIHYTLTPEDLLALWEECTECGSNGIDLAWKSVEKFTLAVNDHFFNTFQLNNIDMPVERVIVKGVSIARMNTLRMKVEDSGLICVLLKFVEMSCINHNHYYTPMTRVWS